MADLRGLVERVEKATGPDRELDGAIHNALFGTAYVRSAGSVTGFMTSATDNGNPLVPIYTNSVDAALALVEKMRPGWLLLLDQYESDWWVNIAKKGAQGGWETDTDANAPTLPLAIILALLRSLDSQGAGE